MISSHFQDINTTIRTYIRQAEYSIKVVSAYFTDEELLEEICMKAAKGVKVELIIADERTNLFNSKVNYMDLVQKRGEFYLANRTPHNSILHHKFCIIDEKLLITGSYNWTKKARFNLENIIVTDDVLALKNYTEEYQNIKTNYCSKVDDWSTSPVWTGFLYLDKITGGFQAHELICLAGSSAMEKTAFLLSMISKMDENFATPIGYINNSVNPEQITKEWLFQKADIPKQKIKTQDFEDYEWQKFYEESDKLKNSSCQIIKETDSLQSLEQACKILRIKHGVKFIIIDKIDHLLNIYGEEFDNEKNNLVLRRLKNLARTLCIPILFTTEVEIKNFKKKHDYTPKLSSLGIIPNYSDIVIFLHRDEYYGTLEDYEGNSLKGIAKLIVAKNITSAKGHVYLKYDSLINKFNSFEEELSEENERDYSIKTDIDDVPF